MICVRQLMHCIAFAAALGAVDAYANRVLSVTSNEEQVTVTNEARGTRWQLNEPLCLFQGARELACGFVGALTEKQIVVKVEAREYKVLPGSIVTLRREGRNVSAIPGTAAERSEMALARRRPTVDVALGPVAGLNYVFPLVPSIQFALDRKLTFGVDVRYSNFCAAGVTGATCLGFMATLNYYYTQYAFKGVFFSVGGGLYSMKLENGAVTEKISPLAFQGLAGWRGRPRWAFPVDVMIAGGFQYVMADTATITLRDNFKGILPVLSLSLGYSF